MSFIGKAIGSIFGFDRPKTTQLQQLPPTIINQPRQSSGLTDAEKQAMAQAGELERRRLAAQRGRSSTILTSGLGTQDEPNVKKSVLGG